MSRSKKNKSKQQGQDRRSFMQMSAAAGMVGFWNGTICLLYTSPSPRD